MVRLFWIVGLLFPSLIAAAAQVSVSGVRYSPAQLALKLSDSAHYRFFTLKSPSRLVIDFSDAKLVQSFTPPPVDHPLFSSVRSASRNGKDLRVVFGLNADAEVKPSISSGPDGAQLQFNLSVNEKNVASPERTVVPVVAPRNDKAIATVALTAKPTRLVKEKAKGRDIVIAIDAGHGGKDVGAQGASGTQEKDVVFAIAKRLESLVNNQPGMRAVMIRKGDYFVKLLERVQIAQAAKADLLVSIHADAFNDPSAHGASVYTLSNKGASSAAARFLADSENAADRVEGGAFDDKDDTLASVLMDLSQSASKEASQNVGSNVLKHVKSVGHLHRSAVQKAGFVVLKSQGIPSILVETAFISNPEEERRLTTGAYQSKMASAVFGGIISHFRQYAPANTLMAQLSKSGKASMVARNDITPHVVEKQVAASKHHDVILAKSSEHVINRGETLSGIAQQYGVSMRALRNANEMADGNVRVGQVLLIPSSI